MADHDRLPRQRLCGREVVEGDFADIEREIHNHMPCAHNLPDRQFGDWRDRMRMELQCGGTFPCV
jgi:hypothetical protein